MIPMSGEIPESIGSLINLNYYIFIRTNWVGLSRTASVIFFPITLNFEFMKTIYVHPIQPVFPKIKLDHKILLNVRNLIMKLE